jgi:hypothetical protein
VAPRSLFGETGLTEIGSFGSTSLKEPVEIFAPEAESSPVAELRRRDGALPRPPPDRLLVYAEVLRSLKSP